MAKLAKSISPTPSGWSGSNHCKWTGVSCDSSGRVSNINLSSKYLSGELPSDLNQLSHLKILSLQRNQFYGPLPSLSNLASLEQVFLDYNNFSSIPPSFLSGLTSLQTLSISMNHNLPPWTIPETLADSTTLNFFDAMDSNIVGPMPEIFGSFPNLQTVRLAYNNLTGSLPQSFSKTGIENLWINNQLIGLSGRIDVLGGMSQLTQAWVHVNKFSGPIPDLSKCTSLSNLQLRDNELTGVIHPSLFSLPKLANVSLQNNRLQGPYPDFPKGVQVTLGMTNNFCNTKPGPCDPQVTALLAVAEALGYPMTLAESWQGNDPCQGWNGISCDPKGSVTVINFGKKQWIGTISPAIANLTALKSVFLNDNKLTGPIPAVLTSLAQLQLLDVSNNNLSGKIPPFTSSVMLKSSGNPFIGKDLPTGGGTAGGGSSAGGGGGGSPSGETSGNGKSSTLRWVIVIVGIAAAIFVVVLSFVIYKRFAKKPRWKYKWVRSSSAGKENVNKKDYGAIGSELPSKSSSDKNVYDGGGVVISIEKLREVTDNFSEQNILGQGGFGVVYRGTLLDGTQIAVKRMESVMAAGSKGLNEFQAEIEVLSKVRHRHLVALHGFCVNGNERLLVYEYMPQGTLGQHLFKYNEMGFPPLTWKQRVTIALDVARGVEYLHSLAQQSFIHRDLKPSNILLGDDMRAKVSDFGLVKNAPDGNYSVETRLAGTFGYLAPEYASTGRVTTKVDVFAFGVVLMEMITGRKALDETLPEETSHLVAWFRRAGINRGSIREHLDPSLIPDEETFESICKVAELAGYCTALEAFQRPDMSHAVNVLSPLVEQWKPASYDEDDGFGTDLHMSLPQVLQRWQASDGSSMTTSNLFTNTATNTLQHPSGFTNSIGLKDRR
ncbi:receptor-like kinase TMK4 [Cornus florida]|uniref:receptor-like kinase TMK4 n=1 Tax=Cornus florida TaxID=4283 RepID=UPI00289B2F7E|nr:receptor-like kinase TMK4 [Cornus florida]